jgi:hypothetical protein
LERIFLLSELVLQIVKNPVWEHGASSMEKAIYIWGLIAPKPTWPFIPARKSGAFWLFHVIGDRGPWPQLENDSLNTIPNSGK